MIKQLDMFSEIGEAVDTRKEFILFKKFAILRKLGWQDFIAKELCRVGDYQFNINSLIPECMEQNDLIALGYTIIIPDRELYRDTYPELKLVYKASVISEKYPSIYVEINL